MLRATTKMLFIVPSHLTRSRYYIFSLIPVPTVRRMIQLAASTTAKKRVVGGVRPVASEKQGRALT